MGFAPSRKAKMFNARNLNNLYARADRKVYLTLQGKSPLLADNWTLSHPAGVWYVFTSGAVKRLYDDGSGIPGIGNVYRLNHDQSAVPFELAKLDSVAIDYAGQQVFCDLWTYATDPTPDADVMAVHYSFETHQRVINDVAYDVHLGLQPPDPWFTGGDPQSSWVRSAFAATNFPPYFPPGRSHRHERSVAEIACEGLNLFVIKKEWTRYDCWRIHNLSDSPMFLALEFPNGERAAGFIPPYECRTARRAANGRWINTWNSGGFLDLPTCHFFPYVTGDIPLFAGGPPQNWNETTNSGEALALERSQSANNIANPWIILEWMRMLKAALDPRAPYDAWDNYKDFYQDPKNDDNAIGDCVFTWGRARLMDANGNEEIITIPNVAALVPTLAGYGIDCTLSGNTLNIANRSRWTRIYALDCNLFTNSNSDLAGAIRYWDISVGSPSFGVTYPPVYCRQTRPGAINQWTASSWSVATPPNIFNTIGTLRRKVLVEAGWMASETEYLTIPEAFAASVVTLTPLGLMMRVPTTTPVYDVAVQVDGTFEYEGGLPSVSPFYWAGLYPRRIAYGVSPDVIPEDNYWAADINWLLASPGNTDGIAFQHFRDVFPSINAYGPDGNYPAIWTSYIPAGGPWGYSRTVYDFEIRRCFEITTDEDVFSNGADFWVNKWGGPGGVDASVRIPGKPDVMSQYRYVSSDTTEGFERVATDDIWFDSTLPLRAGTSFQNADANDGFDGVTLIHPEPQDGASVQPYSILPPYQLHQKIPKTAWLWDLLEYHVRAWRRSYRHVKGEHDIPVAPGRALISCLDAAGSGEESGVYVIYLTFQGYSDLLANGVPCRDDGTASTSPYYVTIDNLAAFISRRGFSYLLDTIQYPPSYPSGVLIHKRLYGPGETTENLGLYSVVYSWYRYANHRFVNLRFQGE